MSSFYAPNYCGTFYSVFDDVTQSGIGSPNTNSGSSHTLLSPSSTPQPYVPLLTQSAGPLSPSAIETSQLSPHILDVPPNLGNLFQACSVCHSSGSSSQVQPPYSPTATHHPLFVPVKETPCVDWAYSSSKPVSMHSNQSPTKALFSPCIQSINMLELSGFIMTKTSIGLAHAVCNADINDMQLLLSAGANPSF